jgi:hypothetical protein
MNSVDGLALHAMPDWAAVLNRQYQGPMLFTCLLRRHRNGRKLLAKDGSAGQYF